MERSLFNFLVNSNDLFIKKRADEIFYMRYNDLFIKKRHSDIIILKKKMNSVGEINDGDRFEQTL